MIPFTHHFYWSIYRFPWLDSWKQQFSNSFFMFSPYSFHFPFPTIFTRFPADFPNVSMLDLAQAVWGYVSGSSLADTWRESTEEAKDAHDLNHFEAGDGEIMNVSRKIHGDIWWWTFILRGTKLITLLDVLEIGRLIRDVSKETWGC